MVEWQLTVDTAIVEGNLHGLRRPRCHGKDEEDEEVEVWVEEAAEEEDDLRRCRREGGRREAEEAGERRPSCCAASIPAASLSFDPSPPYTPRGFVCKFTNCFKCSQLALA